MAIVGPLTSIVLGGLLTLLAALTAVPLASTVTNPAGAIAQLNPLTFLVAWLGSINVLVASSTWSLASPWTAAACCARSSGQSPEICAGPHAGLPGWGRPLLRC